MMVFSKEQNEMEANAQQVLIDGQKEMLNESKLSVITKK